MFTTKGDANNAPDQALTHLADIHGKVLFTIPYLGYVLAFAKTKLGFALLVGVPALAIILEELGKIIREIIALRRQKRSPVALKKQTYTNHVPQNYKTRGVVDLRGL